MLLVNIIFPWSMKAQFLRDYIYIAEVTGQSIGIWPWCLKPVHLSVGPWLNFDEAGAADVMVL